PGARQDRARLLDLASALPEPGVIVDDDAEPGAIASALGQAPFGEVALTVEGASWSWPQTLEGVQPGQDVLVFARYDGARPPAVRVAFSDPSLPSQEIETLEVERPLVERAWARARISAIQHAQARTPAGPAHEAMNARIVDLSTHYRVLTDRTALLVLETEADYRRFRIDRRGKADILAIDGGSVRVQRRSERAPAPLPVEDDLAAVQVAAADPDGAGPIPRLTRISPESESDVLGMIEQESGHFLASPHGAAFAAGNDDEDVWGGEGTIGLGNTGLIGNGGSGSGYGRGSGAGFGGRGMRVPRVRQAKAQVTGALDRDIIRRIVRAHVNEVRHCYNRGLVRDPNLHGRVEISFHIGATGLVLASEATETTLPDASVTQCIAQAVRRWKFPMPSGGGTVRVTMPFMLDNGGAVASIDRGWGGWGPTGHAPRRVRRPPPPAAHTGRFAEAQRLLAAGQTDAAYDLAWSWVQTQPHDVLGLLALGDALEARERPALAARVYGSLIDLHPSRADIRRAAGERLERLGDDGLALAIDTYAKAVESRSDHPSGARLHAWALIQRGDHQAAFDVLHAALRQHYPAGRFAGVKSLLRQDLALVAAAWLAQASGPDLDRAREHIAAAGVRPDTEASTRFVVTWETDTTDVDVLLHTGGSSRNHGRRIADVRTGYGPEARVLRGDSIPAALRTSVRYFDRSSQGHAMGTVHVVSHDGHGHLRVQARPFVLMQQRGVLDLGVIETGVDPNAV
ncbi:MAG: AgmX/PglI C-terminal domain-containing protein, partial [Myxococcales bacterium]|nr:AgmX/PglI C-terminal domain-containing protein [Myxococcales bacterium]